MSEENECFDTSDMDREEVEELLDRIHVAYHEEMQRSDGMETNAGILIESMVQIATDLELENKLGKRKEAMERAVFTLHVLASMAYIAMPGSIRRLDDMRTDSEFDRLTSALEAEDPNFGSNPE